jgi:DNA-directed RNA polymerase specialized sigma24 family protein
MYRGRVRAFRPVERAARRGDNDARRVLVHSYDPLVRRFLQAMDVPSPEAAAQHVWSQLDASRQGSRTERDFAIRLFTIACDTAERIVATASTSALRPRPRSSHLEPNGLLDAIGSLPADEAVVAALRVVVGFEDDDIAAITRRSTEDVRRLTTRGEEALDVLGHSAQPRRSRS